MLRELGEYANTENGAAAQGGTVLQGAVHVKLESIESWIGNIGIIVANLVYPNWAYAVPEARVRTNWIRWETYYLITKHISHYGASEPNMSRILRYGQFSERFDLVHICK